MRIAIANDHAAVEYKHILVNHLRSKGHEVLNFGTDESGSCDYPDYAKKVALAVQKKEVDAGVLICGTGIGMSIAANRYKGVRASVCDNILCAKMTRRHNDSNVLCMGARIIGVDVMLAIADEYFSTPFDEESVPDKHTRRINKIEIE